MNHDPWPCFNDDRTSTLATTEWIRTATLLQLPSRILSPLQPMINRQMNRSLVKVIAAPACPPNCCPTHSNLHFSIQGACGCIFPSAAILSPHPTPASTPPFPDFILCYTEVWFHFLFSIFDQSILRRGVPTSAAVQPRSKTSHRTMISALSCGDYPPLCISISISNRKFHLRSHDNESILPTIVLSLGAGLCLPAFFQILYLHSLTHTARNTPTPHTLLSITKPTTRRRKKLQPHKENSRT